MSIRLYISTLIWGAFFFLPFASFAQIAEKDAFSLQESVEGMEKLEHKRYCLAFEYHVRDGIHEANTCWRDEDCRLEDYGCPWAHGICHRYLTGKDDGPARQKLYEKMAVYEKQCTNHDPDTVKMCEEHYRLTATADCMDVGPLLCVNGRCLTQTHILMQSIEQGEGVDIFGSRRVNDMGIMRREYQQGDDVMEKE